MQVVFRADLSMVVTWWIVAFLHSDYHTVIIHLPKVAHMKLSYYVPSARSGTLVGHSNNIPC